MAARKNKVTLSDTWRERIRTGVIMERLEAHILGPEEGEKGVDLSPTQIAAAKILLSKIVPDLNRTTIEGDADKPVHNKITVEFIGSANSNH